MLTFTPVTLYAALAFARLALGDDEMYWNVAVGVLDFEEVKWIYSKEDEFC